MSAMDFPFSDLDAITIAQAVPGRLVQKFCNYLQNVVAITYIFVLQLPTFLFYNKQIKKVLLHRKDPFIPLIMGLVLFCILHQLYLHYTHNPSNRLLQNSMLWQKTEYMFVSQLKIYGSFKRSQHKRLFYFIMYPHGCQVFERTTCKKKLSSPPIHTQWSYQ